GGHALATARKQRACQLGGAGLSRKASCNILTAPEPMHSKNTDGLDICKFDLNAANAELDKAGWVKGSDGVRAKGPVKLKILYQTTVNPVRQKTPAIMKANWEKVGCQVELQSVHAGSFFTNTAPDGANHFWSDVELSSNR